MNLAKKPSAARIRAARHGAGMTQAQLARSIGVSERNIVRWEQGQHTPRIEHLAAVAEATGHTLDSLYGSDSDDEDEADPTMLKTFEMFVHLVDAIHSLRAREATA